MLSIECWGWVCQGFSQIQLSYFSVTQTAVITSSQYQSVDAAKQQVIRQKLSTVQDDLLNDPTKGGNAGDGDVAKLQFLKKNSYAFAMTGWPRHNILRLSVFACVCSSVCLSVC